MLGQGLTQREKRFLCRFLSRRVVVPDAAPQSAWRQAEELPHLVEVPVGVCVELRPAPQADRHLTVAGHHCLLFINLRVAGSENCDLPG